MLTQRRRPGAAATQWHAPTGPRNPPPKPTPSLSPLQPRHQTLTRQNPLKAPAIATGKSSNGGNAIMLVQASLLSRWRAASRDPVAKNGEDPYSLTLSIEVPQAQGLDLRILAPEDNRGESSRD